MSAILTPHDFYTYVHGFFKINLLNFYDGPLSSICLVFWKNRQIVFKNGFINDAVFIDEEVIELEILRPSGNIYYHYYNPSLKENIVISHKNSEILSLRILNNINTLRNEQKTLYKENQKN